MRAVKLQEFGPSTVLKVSSDCSKPSTSAEKPFLIRMEYASVNYVDTYHRRGHPKYRLQLPSIIGVDGTGVIAEIAEGFDSKVFSVGDRVAVLASHTYAEYVTVNEQQLAKIPSGVDSKEAAACIVSGLTAHMLTRAVFPLKEQHTCLIHAVCGATGSLIAQIAKNICGATVIGTCGSEEKVKWAQEHLKLDHVINYSEESDWDKKVKELTGTRGVDVVYDGVGKATFEKSLRSVKHRGYMVQFGSSSGDAPAIAPVDLSKYGSVYLVFPTVFDYVEMPGELGSRACDVFTWLQQGKLKVHICCTYPLDKVDEAHKQIESRQAQGKIVLKI